MNAVRQLWHNVGSAGWPHWRYTELSWRLEVYNGMRRWELETASVRARTQLLAQLESLVRLGATNAQISRVLDTAMVPMKTGFP